MLRKNLSKNIQTGVASYTVALALLSLPVVCPYCIENGSRLFGTGIVDFKYSAFTLGFGLFWGLLISDSVSLAQFEMASRKNSPTGQISNNRIIISMKTGIFFIIFLLSIVFVLQLNR